MKAAQDRQKSYADLARRQVDFLVRDKVWLKVGSLAYRLALPLELERVHDVFHISQLKRYVHDPTHVLSSEVIPLDEDLTYEERPLIILDFKSRDTRRKSVKMVKVWWTHHGVEEATWELESTMRERYPELFSAGLCEQLVNVDEWVFPETETAAEWQS
ncbi:PREDICTED: uncharacterized protein LOC109166770 [Ipomoea nil]|uniref:uncharacterized protein LOC109166770 n=1 Tax=Ipomoea nil TaxID=35883 RepID=UPI000901B513|nr:PREDICTED: uncharacterized protein LOC109166770 [Ipomoea nil]